MLNYSANGPSGYNLTNSLRFRSSASAYLSRTPASATNRKTWTWSGWVKIGSLSELAPMLFMTRGSDTDATYLRFGLSFKVNNCLSITSWNNTTLEITTTQVFRDPSAWYHIVLAFDTTQATASNRVKMYVNGTQITTFSTANYPSQNTDFGINNNTETYIGRLAGVSNYYFDGYMTEINFIDGQALTPSSFGNTNSTTGVWQPAKYTGTYGTNGFYLNFSSIALTSGSNTGLGKDYSGNGNYWNTNNISVTSGTTYDAMTDVPTITSATVANYAVLNLLNKAANDTISNANLTFTGGTSGTIGFCPATIGVSSGKWYWEVTYVNAGGVAGEYVGIVTTTTQNSGNYGAGQFAGGYDYNLRTGNKYNNGSSTAYGATCTTNDVIGVALDLDGGTLTFYKNNTSQGTAFTGLSGTFAPEVGHDGYQAATFAVNFGQRPFSYTPPTGYVALNTFNLPTSTIVQGNKYMDATIYTGNGAARSITNAGGFSPDLVWIKDRTTAYSNIVYDIIRGTGTANLATDNTQAEGYNASYANLTSFNFNGFSLGNTSLVNVINNNGDSYVAWQWDAGSSTVTNTTGSISSQVRANTTAGFSVVTFNAGTAGNKTVGHGLGVKPAMFVWKDITTTGNWQVWHQSLSSQTQSYLLLNTTAASANDSRIWANTAPTSTLLSFETGYTFNASSNVVAYCWAEIAGFSKFGSYTGNGNADGPFIYLGFRPKFIMIKKSSSTGSWAILDTARNTYNVTNTALYADLSNAENSIYEARDYLSNGFKLRTTDQNSNENGQTFIYMAFAENPFKNALAR